MKKKKVLKKMRELEDDEGFDITILKIFINRLTTR